ncbi:hypothetical protein MA16_Dca007840 [Dendrobium catenatum]|uniref:Uncharacterized protein n=1 Tax=Dendrobium catenatum TaxID=906689 RepID=A0A2I0XJ17_9ASPA|nr:hypothetical protein MA16_Dca007840 [Dendrobium catenatum]
MSPSWSDLPLDLLIIIRNKLQNADLLSFRLVCSQWRYASPTPNPCPLYLVHFRHRTEVIFYLDSDFINDKSRPHVISFPFSSFDPMSFVGCSNGWSIFLTHDDGIILLFDPVSKRKLIFPHCIHVWKVVVSSSIDASIGVACNVTIKDKTMSFLDNIFVFCRHADDDCQRWSLVMKESKSIIDISLAGDGRFYAISRDCKFYILDERPPFIKLKRIKLWLPKHIFESGSDISPPPKRRLRPIEFDSMKASGETNLNICGSCEKYRPGQLTISLKINLAELHGNSNNIEVACDASWSEDDLESSTEKDDLEWLECLNSYKFRPSFNVRSVSNIG